MSRERDEDDFRLPEFATCGDADSGVSCAIRGGICCIVLTLWLAVTSVGTVLPLTYGIRYNSFTKYADTNVVYGPGRHFIGPFNKFIVFPADVQTVEFSNEQRLQPNGVRYPALHSRTKEGLALHLQVSLQYQLIEDQVGNLCAEFNQEYKEMFISTIRDTLIRAASDYEAFQLWEMRQEVGARMQDMVNTALNRVYARCWGLQLMVVELPKKFDDSIVATQVQAQKISTKRFQQSAAIWRAQTSVIAAEFARKVKVIKANGKANYTLQTRIAKGQARKSVLDTEASMMAFVKERLSLDGPEIVKYQRFSALTSMSNATLFYGFNEDSQVLLTSGGRTAGPQSNPSQPSSANPGFSASAPSPSHSHAHVDALLSRARQSHSAEL
eukprot:TRINITY_DN4188_c2_g1_i1.p1 TRINITY_DN4188_c2_g1~~TRINITY_DN4188_c2_g1_i1.p1  ORF type:complete len:384 (+),score=46.77 TRINITY_DN4188_c2_g1_i1:137-1288(+)